MSLNWELVAHACNPIYSGGRDQEDHSSKPTQTNSSTRPYLEKALSKNGWWSGWGLGPEFKPQYHTQKNL
jgi:hypothetical protein